MNPLLPILPACQHRGDARGGWRYECRSNWLLHRTPGLALHETCAQCPFADLPNRESSAPAAKPLFHECIHRGSVIHERKADLCGRRGELFPVYECKLHGECVLTRFCAKQPERLCYNCEDFEPPP